MGLDWGIVSPSFVVVVVVVVVVVGLLPGGKRLGGFLARIPVGARPTVSL